MFLSKTNNISSSLLFVFHIFKAGYQSVAVVVITCISTTQLIDPIGGGGAFGGWQHFSRGSQGFCLPHINRIRLISATQHYTQYEHTHTQYEHIHTHTHKIDEHTPCQSIASVVRCVGIQLRIPRWIHFIADRRY